jgi:hypothetical protein
MPRAEQMVALGRRRGKQLGHDPTIEPMGNRRGAVEGGWWRAVCTCGYVSTRRAGQKQALLTLFWHLGMVAAQSEEGLNGGLRRVATGTYQDQLVGSPLSGITDRPVSADPEPTGRTVKTDPAHTRGGVTGSCPASHGDSSASGCDHLG